MSATSPSASRRRRPWIPILAAVIVGVLAAVIAAVYITGNERRAFPWFYGAAKADNRSIGEGVTVSGDQVPKDLKATKADKSKAVPLPVELRNEAWLQPVSSLLEIGPSGKLPGPTTIKIPVEDATRDQSVFVLSNSTHKPDGWEVMPAQLTPDGRYVQVTIDHLSLFQAFKTLVKETSKLLLDAVVRSLNLEVFQEAKPPKCQQENLARGDGYAVKHAFADSGTIYYCFGMVKDDRTLLVVNNRRYPLDLGLSGMAIQSNGLLTLDLVELYRAQGHTILMPGEQAVLTVNPLALGKKAVLSTKLSNWALGIGVVQTFAEALAAAVFKTDLSRAREKVSLLVNYIWEKTNCFEHLQNRVPNPGKLLADCFSGEILQIAFGKAAADLLAPITTGFAVANATRAILNAVGDRRNDRDKYTITVNRERPDPYEGFAGEWWRHASWLGVFDNGIAQMRIGANYCLAEEPSCTMNIRYQLTPSSKVGEIEGKIIRVWFSRAFDGAEEIDNPILFEDAPRVGTVDTFRLVEGRLEITPGDPDEQAGDLDGDGQLDDGFRWCGDETPKANREPCGA